jgi:hypothetical protein
MARSQPGQLVGKRGTEPCSLLDEGLARARVRPAGSDDFRNGSIRAGRGALPQPLPLTLGSDLGLTIPPSFIARADEVIE